MFGSPVIAKKPPKMATRVKFIACKYAWLRHSYNIAAVYYVSGHPYITVFKQFLPHNFGTGAQFNFVLYLYFG